MSLSAVLTLLEVLFVAVALTGVAMWSVPTALVVGGVVGVVACELAERRRDPNPPPTEATR